MFSAYCNDALVLTELESPIAKNKNYDPVRGLPYSLRPGPLWQGLEPGSSSVVAERVVAPARYRYLQRVLRRSLPSTPLGEEQTVVSVKSVKKTHGNIKNFQNTIKIVSP